MKKLNTVDLRAKTVDELKDLVKKSKSDLTTKREGVLMGKDKKVSTLMGLRKDIARMHTVLKEKSVIEEIV